MSRALSGRMAALESHQRLRWFQEALTTCFLVAADEVGLPPASRAAILVALQEWHAHYSLPPAGWHLTYDAAFPVADAHTLAARRILEQHIADHALLRAVADGMHDRLMALVRGSADDPAP